MLGETLIRTIGIVRLHCFEFFACPIAIGLAVAVIASSTRETTQEMMR